MFRISDLPSDERPRERLARLGAAALSGEELLALLLGSGIRGESALDSARADPDRAWRARGAGGAFGSRAARGSAASRRPAGSVIEAALEIGRRLAAESLSGRDLLNEPSLVKDYLRRARGPTARRSEPACCI